MSSGASGKSDFPAHIMRDVAMAVLPEFLGKPNDKLSSKDELVWGSKGSLKVDLIKGTWFDHEDGAGGGVLKLLKDFKGLDEKEAVAWLEEKGYLKPRANGAANGKAEKFLGFIDHFPIATYQYFDENDQLAYEILKFPKEAAHRFMQRRPHPSGDGSWIWALRGGKFGRYEQNWWKWKEGRKYEAVENFADARLYLYRRTETLLAASEGRTIVIVGGEKDAETVCAWGIAGTTNSGGEAYWQDKFTDELAGANIVICHDNDKAGRQRAIKLGAILIEKANSVRVLDLARHWPDMPEKADVTDWKEQCGGTAAEFKQLIAEAPNWAPDKPPSQFGAFTWTDLDLPGHDQSYVIDGWLTEHGRCVIGGASKSGKSFLAVHMAMCISRGVDFFDYPVTSPGGVIYQAGEGGLGIKKRFLAYRRHFEVDPKVELPIVPMTRKINLYDASIDLQPFIDECRAWAVWLRYRFKMPLREIVIDTLSAASRGADENSGKDMGAVTANVAKIEEACGCHVTLVHHMNATGSKLRGHTSLYADSDQVIMVSHNEQTRMRTAILDKQKDDEDGLKINFTLASVRVGQDDNSGRDITSCVVLTVDEKERLQREREQFGYSVRPNEEKILMALFKAVERYGKFVANDKDGPAEAIGRHVVRIDDYLKVAAEMDPLTEEGDEARAQAKDRLRKVLSRNSQDMIKYKIIGVAAPYIWHTGKPIRGFPNTFPPGSQFRTNPGQIADNPGTNPGHEDSPGMLETLFSDDGLPF